MAVVACLLLPVVAMMLYGMDRTEDWLSRPPKPRRHARARHLRLIQGGRGAEPAPTDPAPAAAEIALESPEAA